MGMTYKEGKTQDSRKGSNFFTLRNVGFVICYQLEIVKTNHIKQIWVNFINI